MASTKMASMEVSSHLERMALRVSDSLCSSGDEPIQPGETPTKPPSSHCVSPCSATFTIAPSVQSNQTAHGPTRALATTALEPSSRSESPEPPPPRA